jgi:hypothetical protein
MTLGALVSFKPLGTLVVLYVASFVLRLAFKRSPV